MGLAIVFPIVIDVSRGMIVDNIENHGQTRAGALRLPGVPHVGGPVNIGLGGEPIVLRFAR